MNEKEKLRLFVHVENEHGHLFKGIITTKSQIGVFRRVFYQLAKPILKKKEDVKK